MRHAVIATTEFYTPPDSISNAELVEAFNAYVERFNAENAAAIAEGRIEALLVVRRVRRRRRASSRAWSRSRGSSIRR